MELSERVPQLNAFVPLVAGAPHCPLLLAGCALPTILWGKTKHEQPAIVVGGKLFTRPGMVVHASSYQQQHARTHAHTTALSWRTVRYLRISLMAVGCEKSLSPAATRFGGDRKSAVAQDARDRQKLDLQRGLATPISKSLPAWLEEGGVSQCIPESVVFLSIAGDLALLGTRQAALSHPLPATEDASRQDAAAVMSYVYISRGLVSLGDTALQPAFGSAVALDGTTNASVQSPPSQDEDGSASEQLTSDHGRLGHEVKNSIGYRYQIRIRRRGGPGLCVSLLGRV
ncbi:hypothetical protein PG991_012957 [Apiospora marii]|uniref:Uncharacterized protein n=1 Tax=Apiospora marii TaxID=335849 RepID=A0ABR1RB60_9PEZI